MAEHGIGFAAAGLTVREDGGVEATESGFDDGSGEGLVDLLVCRVGSENMVEKERGWRLALSFGRVAGDGVVRDGPGMTEIGWIGGFACIERADANTDNDGICHLSRGGREERRGEERRREVE